MEKINRKDFEKVQMPEVVKLTKVGESISGEYISIEPSKEYKESFALMFKNNDKVSIVFIPSQAQKLFEAKSVQKKDLFILDFIGKQENKDKTFSYNVYDLFVKRGQ